jgi:hypothetical protein
MTRRFRAFNAANDTQLEVWLNAMAAIPEESLRWRHHSSRQLKVEAIQTVVHDAGSYILAVISRLEDDDEG